MRNSIRAGVLLLLACAAPLSAQSAYPWSVQGSVLYEDLTGDFYDGIDNGFGGELQVRYSPSAFSIGAGVQGTVHQFSDAELDGFDIVTAGVFVEPRLVINTGSNSFAPYVALRLAVTRMEITGGDFDAGSDGTTVNAGAGVLLRLSPRANLDVGASYGRTDWGELTLGDFSEDIDPGENLIVRLGVAIGIGG